jgi:hypothetical protein
MFAVSVANHRQSAERRPSWSRTLTRTIDRSPSDPWTVIRAGPTGRRVGKVVDPAATIARKSPPSAATSRLMRA